ncbi:MAG: cell envelope integrity protein CreD [bacterium]|nr:cell envelope integrity protein CreD [bacterium]
MSVQGTIERASGWLSNSATIKVMSIGILVLVLLIPGAMIKSLIKEREQRRNGVVHELNGKWGNSQTLSGPFISVPYLVYFQDSEGKEKKTTKLFHILPETLNISGTITPEKRYRGIYETVLYNAQLQFSGSFVLPPLSDMNIEPGNFLWDKAFFSVGIADLRGVRASIVVTFNEQSHACKPGLKSKDLAETGVGAFTGAILADQKNTFSFSLNLNGSEELNFIPLAESNTVQLASTWPSPGFNGAFLPESRTVNAKGFTASWKVLNLNRSYPQMWEGDQYQVQDSAFGLKLIVTADLYQKTTRVAKYAVMFIVCTFAAFFIAEITSGYRFHVIQYVLIGLAILLFYVLLLSLSEHFSFNGAYLTAAAAITLLIALYSKGILGSRRFAWSIAGILAAMHSFLFVVLQLEDYALVLGSGGLLAVLAAIMYITRNIDWHHLAVEADDEDESLPSSILQTRRGQAKLS